MMTDSSVSFLNTILQWIAVVGTALALLSAIGMIFTFAELAKRSDHKLHRAEKKLSLITTDRTIFPEVASVLTACLQEGPKGKIIITFLSVESDAKPLAVSILQILQHSGFNASLSDRIWVNFIYDGLFICVNSKDSPPLHAQSILDSFNDAGISVQSVESPNMFKKLSAPEDSIVFVLGKKILNAEPGY